MLGRKNEQRLAKLESAVRSQGGATDEAELACSRVMRAFVLGFGGEKLPHTTPLGEQYFATGLSGHFQSLAQRIVSGTLTRTDRATLEEVDSDASAGYGMSAAEFVLWVKELDDKV